MTMLIGCNLGGNDNMDNEQINILFIGNSFTFYNETTGKIVTMVAYVYKPNEKKRNLLKQVEAILYSVKI